METLRHSLRLETLAMSSERHVLRCEGWQKCGKNRNFLVKKLKQLMQEKAESKTKKYSDLGIYSPFLCQAQILPMLLLEGACNNK